MKPIFYLVAPIVALVAVACSTIGENTEVTPDNQALITKSGEGSEVCNCDCGCGAGCPLCADGCIDDMDHDQSTMPDEDDPEMTIHCGCMNHNGNGGGHPGGIDYEVDQPKP